MSHRLLQAITDVCVNFLVSQQRAGAQALQVFESVGAEFLTQEHYYEFAFPYLEQVLLVHLSTYLSDFDYIVDCLNMNLDCYSCEKGRTRDADGLFFERHPVCI